MLLVAQRFFAGFAGERDGDQGDDGGATRYQAGARSLAVAAIRSVAMNGAVPPKSALERLKLTAKPL